jgi:hypothetical protein
MPLAISLALDNLVEALVIGPVGGDSFPFPLLTDFLGKGVLFAFFLVLVSASSESSSMIMVFYSLMVGLNIAFEFSRYLLLSLVEFLRGFCDTHAPFFLFPLTAMFFLLVDGISVLTTV